MNLNEITKKVNELAQKSPGDMDSIVNFVFVDGCVRVDDTENPPEESNKNEDAHCTIKLSNETFTKLLNKETSSMNAFMSGKMKIDGDMTVAMKLSSIFG